MLETGYYGGEFSWVHEVLSIVLTVPSHGIVVNLAHPAGALMECTACKASHPTGVQD